MHIWTIFGLFIAISGLLKGYWTLLGLVDAHSEPFLSRQSTFSTLSSPIDAQVWLVEAYLSTLDLVKFLFEPFESRQSTFWALCPVKAFLNNLDRFEAYFAPSKLIWSLFAPSKHFQSTLDPVKARFEHSWSVKPLFAPSNHLFIGIRNSLPTWLHSRIAKYVVSKLFALIPFSRHFLNKIHL